jgi:cob(I)alamin adenosyltransferase
MRVLTNLKDTVATDALIGRLPIGATLHHLRGLCRASERQVSLISSTRGVHVDSIEFSNS